MVFSALTRFIVAAHMFVVDLSSLVRGTGRQIDWSAVSEKFQRGAIKVKVNGAVAKGATSVTVDALTNTLPAGTLLDFGTVESVTVTVSASALVAATSISVNALSAALPSGAVLDFGTTKFARLTAAAAAGATSLTVAALPTALAGGETAAYQGGDRVLRLTETGEVGETALTIETAPFAIADDAEAYAITDELQNLEVGAKWIPAGTVMALLSSGKLIPRSDVTGAETSYCILETEARNDSKTDSLTGYGTLLAGHFYENLLPDADPSTGLISSTYKTELRARGGAFLFSEYHDSRSE